MFLASAFSLITAQFARHLTTFNRFSGAGGDPSFTLSNDFLHRATLNLLDLAGRLFSPALLHLKIVPRAVAVRSCCGKGKTLYLYIYKLVTTFSQKRLYRSAFKFVLP